MKGLDEEMKNTSIRNIRKAAFVMAVFFMIMFPAVNTNLKMGQVSSMDNRKLVEFPFGRWREQP